MIARRGLLARALVAMLFVAAAARASDLERFQPAETPYAGFATSAGELLAPSAYVIGFHLDYERDPLVFRVNGARVYSTVQNDLTLQPQVAFGLFQRFELGVAAPLVLYENGNDPRFPALPEQTFGDLRVHPRIQLFSQARDGIGVVFTPTVTIPLSRSNSFADESSVRLLPEADVSYRAEEWFLSGALLFDWRGPATSSAAGAVTGNELDLTLAAGRILNPTWELVGELIGGASLKTFRQGVLGNPLEGLAGVRYRDSDNLTYQLLAGVGIFAAPGVPDFRIVWGVLYGSGRPRPAQLCALHDPAGTRLVPVRGTDLDGDGVDDACDLCPYTPGPPPNGCPLPASSTPQPCPSVQAAPPPPPAIVAVKPPPVVVVATPSGPRLVPTKKRQVIFRPIEFEFDEDVIRPDSLPMIKELATEFEAMPRVMVCRVVGHTDRVGTSKYNLDLSERRAAAVVRELIAQGVDPKRVSSKGLGATRPVAPNDTEENRRKNRRVEFIFEIPDAQRK